ncbi:MAG: diacylglycerol kinase family lipid kinase [Gemmatimonadota bacterium]|nr:diacylglycerol kinase family lipid kinase [Gemmatimonadota bacterium]MDH4351449.1 diacylglycerol kinase family lipid kinase [Gemmatimonadota bacterium]MDH5195959.1 diacylglycerol kinase family lipid kinase [Gemmatimonadota bacterium]
MARVMLITNPAAARTNPGIVRTVSDVLGREGWGVDVVDTTHAGHAAELAADGVRDGVDVIAVHGGDGTTMQAVKGMQGSDVPLGMIPGGTGNLLAGNLRIPRDPAKAALAIARERPRDIDLGSMARPDGAHFFAVAAGAGFDAELMAGTTPAAKRRWKMAAYVARAWGTGGTVKSVPSRITVDDRVIECKAASVLVANCAEFIPPFVTFRKGVAIDDGLFDVVILTAEGLFESLGVVLEWITGDDSSTRVQYARGRMVRVEMEPSQAAQIDGEPAGRTPFTAELLPGALRVIAPA